MIQEDYCSPEVKELLREKGFNGAYAMPKCNSNVLEITHQTAMKWLREVHNKYCDIGYDYYLNWFFQIIDLKETTHYDYTDAKYYHAENEFDFNSYREAVEAALKYCLTELI